MTTAYVTHGRKYHTDPACPRMINGEDLHDWEGDSEYDSGFTSGTYRREDPSPQYAAMRGKLPCLYCVPDTLRVFPPLYRQTFGHEPTEGPPDYRGRKTVCARCRTRTVTVHRASQWNEDGYTRSVDLDPVPWPCTSALILGLTPRSAP